MGRSRFGSKMFAKVISRQTIYPSYTILAVNRDVGDQIAQVDLHIRYPHRKKSVRCNNNLEIYVVPRVLKRRVSMEQNFIANFCSSIFMQALIEVLW